VTLEEIDNVDDFVEKLESIELPAQMVSFLTDPLLQKYLMLRPSEIAARRIDLWIGACLEEDYERVRRGEEGSELLSEILECVCRLSGDAKVSLGV